MSPEEFLTLMSTLAVALIITIYVALVIKLRVPKDYAEKREYAPEEKKKDEKLSRQDDGTKTSSEKPQQRQPIVKGAIHLAQPQQSPKTGAQHLPPSQENKEEQRKSQKEGESKKSFYLFGEKNFEGCPHKFGYLKSLPKNMPIPDECFGCGEILECVRNHKTNGKQQQ